MIQYQATVPVPCRKTTPCSVFFIDRAYETINGQCKRNKAGSCGFEIRSDEWEAIRELRVTGEFDNRYGVRLAEIFLKSAKHIPDGPLNVWTDVSPQVALVSILLYDKRTEGNNKVSMLYKSAALCIDIGI